jgi:HEAT repeat protein
MSGIPSELRKKITSSDPRMREEAASDLRNFPSSESLGYLKKMLSDDDSEVVYAATRSIVSIGSREAVEEIIPLLGSEDARLRNLAIEIIGRIGTVAIPRVGGLLSHRDKDIRKFAADILKMIGTPEAEDPLIRALFDENVNVAVEAAEALGSIGTQRSVPYLAQCLEKEPWLKCAALKSLGEIDGDEALEAILAVDPESESMVLFSAVTALESIGDSRGMDFLIALLEKVNSSLESPIVQAMASILRNADSDTIEKAKRRLPTQKIIALLRNSNADALRSAIVLLGMLRAKEAVGHLAKLYNESNEHVFEELEDALLRIESNVVEPMIKIIESEEEPETVKIAAVRLLGKMNGEDIYNPLVALLKDCQDELKKEIIMALAALKDRRVLGILHTILAEDTAEVKQAAIEALETFREGCSIPHLIQLSADPAELVRSKAAGSLRGYNLKDNKEDISGLLERKEPELILFGLDMIPDELLAEFERYTLALCQNEHHKVRRRAVERVSSLRHDTAFEAVANSLSDPVSGVRLAGIRGLEKFPHCDVGKLLLNAACSDPEDWNRYEAVNVIGRLRLLNMLPALVSLLESAPNIVKAGILDVLGHLGDSEHRKIIEVYADSEDELLRDAAMEFLGRSSEASP